MSGPSVKIPADWLDSDTIEDLGGDTVVLMLTAFGWSARQTTNGVVPRRQLRKLWHVDDVDDAVDQLIKAGEVEDRGADLYFVNWRDFILSQDEVDQARAGNRERSERSRRHKRGDHSMCRPDWCRAASRSRDESRDGHGTVRVSDGHPIRSDPTRPDRKGGEDGEGEGSPDASGGSAGASPAAATVPPIGITGTSRAAPEDLAASPNDEHVEITIGIRDYDNERQEDASTICAAAILEQASHDLTKLLDTTKSNCDCYEDQWGNNCSLSTSYLYQEQWDEDGPVLYLCVPASDYLRWERHIAGALKNATALITTWSGGGAA